jgi:hypothetical protein
MFQWYQNAVVCYVYLADLAGSIEPSDLEAKLPKCRWFYRGWTLQELLAPTEVIFYSEDWSRIGTRNGLHRLISRITGIERAFLSGERLDEASVAKKMSWAAKRQTTRLEDIAYCLLGIFEINMSLLYGEGERAFQRLQHKIMKVYPEDQTLFAWGVMAESPPMEVTDPAILGRPQNLAWDAENVRPPLLGLLAKSPKDFEHSSALVALPFVSKLYRLRKDAETPRVIGKGLQVTLIETSKFYSVYHREEAGVSQIMLSLLPCLLCTDGNKIFSILLPLYPWGNCYGRTKTLVPGPKVLHEGFDSIFSTNFVQAEQRLRLRGGDFLVRADMYRNAWKCMVMLSSTERIRNMANEDILRPAAYNRALFAMQFAPRNRSVATEVYRRYMIVFGRSKSERGTHGVFNLGFVPLSGNGQAHLESAGKVKWPTVDEAAKNAQFSVTATDHSWTLNEDGLPRIHVSLTRMPLEDGSGVVDVVDMYLEYETTPEL